MGDRATRSLLLPKLMSVAWDRVEHSVFGAQHPRAVASFALCPNTRLGAVWSDVAVSEQQQQQPPSLSFIFSARAVDVQSILHSPSRFFFLPPAVAGECHLCGSLLWLWVLSGWHPMVPALREPPQTPNTPLASRNCTQRQRHPPQPGRDEDPSTHSLPLPPDLPPQMSQGGKRVGGKRREKQPQLNSGTIGR